MALGTPFGAAESGSRSVYRALEDNSISSLESCPPCHAIGEGIG